MERLLARLERRLGRFAIPNLILFIVGGMAVVWVLAHARPESLHRLTLDINAVRHGQFWRLVTFLFIPPSWEPIWIFVNLYFAWWIGSSLEQNWGAFKFNAYYLLGAVATIIASVIAGPTTNVWLNASVVLAFATVFPDVTILLFFVLPVRVKWLGIAGAAYMGLEAVRGSWDTRAAIAAALLNYLLFFGEHWSNVLRQRKVVVRQKVRRAELESSAPVVRERACAICGAREADGADIRVCSCEKCGGRPRELCLEHARNH
jgi:membrane associated rhomboid family serine protease